MNLIRPAFVLLCQTLLLAACGVEPPAKSAARPDEKPATDAGPVKYAPLPEGFFEALDSIKTLEDCRPVFERFPQIFRTSECFLIKARQEDRRDEAISMLQSIVSERPDHLHARFILANMQKDEQQMLAVISQYKQREKLLDEARGRLYFANYLRKIGRLEPIQEQLDLALDAAERDGRRGMICKVRLKLAQHSYHLNDYGRSFRQFKELEDSICFKMKEMQLRGIILDGLASTSFWLGYYDESFAYYKSELQTAGAKYRKAEILANMGQVARKVEQPGRIGPEEILKLEQDALEAALAGHDIVNVASARLALGDNWLLSPKQRLDHLQQAMPIFSRGDNIAEMVTCLASQAETRLQLDMEQPQPAFELIDKAIELARERGELESLALAWSKRAILRFRAGSRSQAIVDAQSALDAIEGLRFRQADPLSRARLQSRFVPFYRFYSGRMLRAYADSSDEQALRIAIRTSERMRARSLIASLAQRKGADSTLAGQKASKPTELESRRIRLQKELMDPYLPTEQRERLLAELDKAELKIQSARYDIHAAAEPGDVPVADLEQLQSALAEDQALLAYQIEKRSDLGLSTSRQEYQRGGSWLVLITRSQATPIALGDCEQLEPQVRLFGGLIERRDGSEKASASLLYQKLLAPALDCLPPGVKRLVIVPDDPLFGLPFEALRARSDAAPLVQDYGISVVPSATLWLELIKRPRTRADAAALVLADPLLPEHVEDSPIRYAGIFYHGFQLGRLPHSRQEGQAVVDSFGGKSRMLKGPGANERFFKQAPLVDFQFIHFATHAVVDERNPHRSAVILAAGGSLEDGLLQADEISQMDLRGKIVLLSTCSSASGTLVEGEGVMSLARAFFQAGADAVIASLWRLRDEEASELIGAFAHKLSQGESLGAALQSTKRDWARQAKPTAAWAGLVLQGNADVTFSIPTAALSPTAILCLAIGALVIIVLMLLLLRRRATR